MKKRYWIPLSIILFIFLLLHFALEPIALRQVNRALGNLEGMHGRVNDVSIQLYRGAYQVDSLYIFTDKQTPEDIPFFAVSTIDISLEWSSLFRGEIVGDVGLINPVLNYVYDGQEVDDGDEADLGKVLDDLVPFRINTFTVENGEIHYLDPTASPKVDVFIQAMDIQATNLGNLQETDKALPSSVSITGTTNGGGVLTGNIDLNILKAHPDMDANIELEGVDLTALNDFTEAYAKFTFSEGQMYVGTEIVMKDGVFEGYTKPIFSNVKISDQREEDQSFWRRAWEGIVGAAFGLFENPEEEQVATRIPFEGDTTGTDTKLIPTIFNVFRNAFIEAFQKDLDHELEFGE
ncbi:DUF748 domain-containing protein [Litoribacter ruber]|uniref:DUF748 domain-containing protein n=1 Tax=Litoribacter ruber TaxID=702568 RepID=A0AAP2CH97_9BACT|nr:MULTISPECIES: DUF748 domain-containing protein [Litoribacter]MBS9524658.1 DUF748 domain-containing protein [Litoribacter alkaliphilus]MBT0812676.1 DUF748 domain-containing protein [Litoribacter ruber]